MSLDLPGAMLALEKQLHTVDDTRPALSFHREKGEMRLHMPKKISNHARIALHAGQRVLQSWIEDLPLVNDIGMDYSLAVFFEDNFRRKPRARAQFRLSLMGISQSRVAALSTPIATGIFPHVRERLLAVQQICKDEPRHAPARYLIIAKKRADQYLLARGPREAAWLYAATVARNRKEMVNWQNIMDDIVVLARRYEEESWRLPPSPGAAQVQ